MSDLNTEIIINLSGNLQQKARQFSGSMDRFSDKNTALARTMRGSFNLIDRGFSSIENRYTALITTVAGGAMANRLITQDRRLSRLAVAAEMTKEQINNLYEDIEDTSQNYGLDPKETLAGIEVIMEKIGDYNLAVKNMENIAIVTQATGARGEDVGAVLTQLKTLGIEAQDEVMTALDTLNLQGKSGSFTLAEFASNGERIIAKYAATGRSGVDAIREVGAAMQVIRKGVGSGDQAVTAYERMITELTDPKRVAALKKYANINVFDQEQLKQGVEIMRPLPELMKEITLAVDGKSKRWSILNFGDEAKRAFTSLEAEYKKTGQITGFDEYNQILGDGTQTLKDAALVAGDYQGTLQSLGTALNQLANRELAKPMTELAEAVKSLTPEDVERWLELGKNIAYVIGGLVIARKGLGVMKDLRSVFGKTGGTGGFGGMGGIGNIGFGLGTPVYVTNWPGGFGNSPGGFLPDGSPNKGGKVSWWKQLFGSPQALLNMTTVGYGLSLVPELGGLPPVSRMEDRPVQAHEPSFFGQMLGIDKPLVDAPDVLKNYQEPGLLDAFDEIAGLFSSSSNGEKKESITPNFGLLGGLPVEAKIKVEVDDKRAKVTQAEITTNLPGRAMVD